MKLKNIGIIVLIVVFIVILKLSGAFQYISMENLLNLKKWIESFGILGPLVYIVLYIISTLFFLPGTPVTVLGGIVFGPVKGLLYTIIGAGIGLSLAFLTARYALRGSIEEKFANSSVFKKLDEGVKNEGWRILITTRLVPIFPFNVQNYVYGLTNISFIQYSVLSTIFIIPGTTALVFSAGAIASGEGFSTKNLMFIAIGALLFVLVSLIPKFLRVKENDSENKEN
jgi:uncharacterized membrane protein YdjX (TVP38/TMEM64 family)